MKRKILTFVMVLAFIFSLAGCKGYRETDTEYFVSAVCFEKQEEKFKAYIEVVVMNEEDKNTSNRVFTSTGQTPYDAVYNATTLMPKKAVFDHCSTAVIGTDIVGKDFKSVIKYLYDVKNLNLGIYLFVSSDIPGILDCKSQTMSIGYDIMEIETNIVKSSGISFKNKYYEICSKEILNRGFCLPRVTQKSSRPKISGQTVYSKYHPVAELNEKSFFNLLLSGSRGGEIDIANRRCRVNRISSSIKIDKDQMKVEIKCRYRHASDDISKGLKKDVEKLIECLEGNSALSVLGAPSYDKLKKVEVSVNGK